MRNRQNGKENSEASPTTGGHPMQFKILIITFYLLIFAAPALSAVSEAEVRTFKAAPIKTEDAAKQVKDSISDIMHEMNSVTGTTSSRLGKIYDDLEQAINNYKSSADAPKIKKAYADSLAATCEALDSVVTLPERLSPKFNNMDGGLDSRIAGLADYANTLNKKINAASTQLKARESGLLFHFRFLDKGDGLEQLHLF